MGWKKEHTNCCFTIHSITLSTSETSPFQVKWKLGKKTGMTEKILQSGNNLLSFQKIFNITTSLKIDSENNDVKSKILKLTLRYVHGQHSKTYAKLEIDISKFFNAKSSGSKSYIMKAKHRSYGASATISIRFGSLETSPQNSELSSSKLPPVSAQKDDSVIVDLSRIRKRERPHTKFNSKSHKSCSVCHDIGLPSLFPLDSEKSDSDNSDEAPKPPPPGIPPRKPPNLPIPPKPIPKIPEPSNSQESEDKTESTSDYSKYQSHITGHNSTGNISLQENMSLQENLLFSTNISNSLTLFASNQPSRRRHTLNTPNKSKSGISKAELFLKRSKDSNTIPNTNNLNNLLNTTNNLNNSNNSSNQSDHQTLPPPKINMCQSMQLPSQPPLIPDLPLLNKAYLKPPTVNDQLKTKSSLKILTPTEGNKLIHDVIAFDYPKKGIESIPQAAAVIFSAFVYVGLFTNIYDDNTFEAEVTTIVHLLKQKYCQKESSSLLNLNPLGQSDTKEKSDKKDFASCYDPLFGFIVYTFLIAFARAEPKLILQRILYFSRLLEQLAVDTLEEYILDISGPYITIFTNVLSLSDSSSIVSQFKTLSDERDKNLSLYNGSQHPELIKFITNSLIQKIDESLVDIIIGRGKTVKILTFQNAMEWNSFLTLFSTETGIEMKLFREIVAVLMTSTTLSNQPSELREIAPTLSPHTVLQILENQIPDEIMPITIDSSKFAEFYHITHDDSHINIQHKTIEIGPLVKSLPVKWSMVEINPTLYLQFQYLSSYIDGTKIEEST